MLAIANLVFWQGFSAIAAAMSRFAKSNPSILSLEVQSIPPRAGRVRKAPDWLQLSLLEPLTWYFKFVTKVFTEILIFNFVTKMFAINFVTKTCHV